MPTAPVGRCKLCLRRERLKFSHVLPEFLDHGMYHQVKRHAVQITSDSDKVQKIQKGIREYLLCGDCEAQLSRYERYAAPIIKAIPSLPLDSSGRLLETPRVDYAEFKLFQMSIIWRASVSSHRMFTSVSLGDQEERLRLMLRNEQPGRPHQYGCLMYTLKNTKHLSQMIWSPVPDTKFGRSCFCFQIGEIFWYFFRSVLPKSNPGRQGFLSEAGELKIYIAPWTEDEIWSQYVALVKMRPQATKS
jgi:hypothetical protein